MRARGSAQRRWFAASCLLGIVCAPRVAAAAGPECAAPSAPSPASAHAWPAPLDRLVTLQARDVALRAALDRLSAATGIPFAYSPDLLPLDRRVCILAEGEPLGVALDALLHGTGVAPSVIAGRVVLVPRDPDGEPQLSAPHRGVDVLERVVVTGNAIATARRPLTIGVEVIDGARLRRQSITSLADLLDAAVPGAWLWASSPSSLLAQYGSIRGASSFGTSAPKIYLDGVEVANPLVITQLDADAIDRVEIIRGPQGSALYGSDAISGVVNVLTRHDASVSPGARVLLSSMAGAGYSAFGPNLVPTYDERAAARIGDGLRSAGVAAQFGQTGAVFPAATTRQMSLVADARAVGASSVWSATARLFDRSAGVGNNPLLSGLSASAIPEPVGMTTTATTTTEPDLTPQSARQYTVGAGVTVGNGGAFTHSLLVGADGYRLAHVAVASALYPVPADSALAAIEGAGDRVTVRASTVGRFGGDGTPATTLTLGVDQSTLRLQLPVSNVTAPPAGLPYPIAREGVVEQWNHNTGLFTQVSTAWRDAVYLSAGLRVEQNDAFTGADRHPLLPMLGVATVRDFGAASLKLRAAYGRGIRPPSVAARGTYMEQGNASLATPALDPESQSGTEVGAELYVGGLASLQVTRFDQLASGLIQNVLVAVDTQMRAGRAQQHMLYQLQNVGQIANHGWELQGALTKDALSLRGALTLLDSRVRTVADGYAGDLRAGDLMLGVPTRTASLTAAWTAHDWTAALSASRASRWVNYDRLSLARDYAAAGPDARDIVGARLRSYWMAYDGDTHVRLTGSRTIRGALELVLVADNLLGGQLGEPDNVTIRPGRTITAGLRTSF